MSPAKMDRIESAIRAVVEFNHAFNRKDIEGINKVLASDCIIEDSSLIPLGRTCKGYAEIAQHYQNYFEKNPDSKLETEEIFGLGIRCVVRWKMKRTNENGTERISRGADIYKVQNGLICEKLSYEKL